MLNETTAEDGPYLSLRGITKQFPGCLANDRVDLTVARNEIHALLGENGAGKSTLVKIIYGVLRPDAGEIIWRGESVAMQSPAHARRLGIGMVFQHFSLFESLTVAENVALGINDRANRANLRERIADISREYGLPLSPDQTVHDLSVGERQRIEIVRCLLQNPRLLIMDEPTSVLTPQEVEKLFATLRRLASEGCSILYISHKLEEIRALCDTATIMRLGRVVAHCVPSERSAKELAELMINAQLDPPSRSRRIPAERGRPRLAVENLCVKSPHPFGVDLREVGFAVSRGEILGVAGIAGNGQSELMDALSGEVRADAPETIMLDGVAVGRLGSRERRNLGGCFVPEERNGHAAVGAMTLSENAFLTAGARAGGSLTWHGFVDQARSAEFASEIILRFDVRTTGPKALARSLSGGNLQKFLVGREVMQSPGALIVNQPTWGLDAGAAAAIQRAMADLAEKGAAVVIISQDLDEIFLVCDRVAVIAGGRLSPPTPVEKATIEQIGLVMGGAAAWGHA
ncbi:MAG: ABC transporter ATP-binding protein [Roseiarcus sp.]|jgi:simple sugar transport system ATP-binding protein